ncbi:MAG TPA: DUF4340 domain-containing protein [Steroidobacteraceae bacterium]|jgi:hypothetical protein
MSVRRVTVLLLLGVLIIAFAIWLSSTRHLAHATLAGDLVLPGLESAVNSVTEVRLHKGDGTQTTLRKGASDWTVSERSYAADSGKVRKLLLDLAALNVVEEKTRTPEYYPQLGVEDVNSPKATGVQVDAVTAKKTYSLIVGKSSSGKSGFVRVVGQPESLLAQPLVSLDPAPQRWLEPEIIDIQQERIKEFSVKPASGPSYTATRDTKQQQDFKVTDIPKGRELASPTAADPMAGSLAGLTLDDVHRASDQPATGSSTTQSPAAAGERVTFRTFDGLEVEVAGRKDGTRTLITLTPRSSARETQGEAASLEKRLKGWEFEIPSYKYTGMFRPLEELLKKLPEPAKGAKSGAKPGKAKQEPGATPTGPAQQ